jgi:ubiquinone/menaquinone biosynthesis C-methylase UbiE
VNWVPRRRRGVEILDDPATPGDVRRRSMADVARANMLFGGTRSALRALDDAFRDSSQSATLLDVGTGLGDIARAARDAAARGGIAITVIGLDMSVDVLRVSRVRDAAVVVGNALQLPLRSASVDVVVCSQLLHHFEETAAGAVITELQRVSRGWVVISDLRRSWLAAAGFWVASIVLRFHPVTRHDGVTSVLRGFTASELRRMVREATRREPRIRRGMFWRLSAAWRARV